MLRIYPGRLAAVALAAGLAAPCAAADETPGGGNGIFQLGVRVVYLSPQSAPIGSASSISGKVYPELDGEWFLGPSWSTELAIGAPTNFSTNAFDGAAIRLMPISWTAKYLFAPDSRVRPYLGAGVHYTRSSLAGGAAGNFTTIDSSSVGVVAQGGLELRASPTWCVNLDIRYLSLQPGTGTAQGSTGQDVKIDPLLYSVGIGYRW
jgi:outer membrane protein